MKVNAILFSQGSAGNFLARVLTLDPATVCLGQEDIATAKKRCEYYCYDELTEPPNTFASNGLSVWVDQELKKFYFPFTRGIEKLAKLDALIIEPIHPSDWADKQKLLGPDDQVQLYYIDITNCESWVKKQVKYKIFAPGNIDQALTKQMTVLDSILSKEPTAQAILLENIINSEASFVDEYQKICYNMNIKSHSKLALKIYQTWRRTWAL